MIIIAKVDKYGEMILLDGTIHRTEKEAAEYMDNYSRVPGSAYDNGYRLYHTDQARCGVP